MADRQQRQPGCGGCFIILVLLTLLLGGAPALMKLLGVMGFVIATLLFIVVAAFTAFVGFSYYMRKRVAKYADSQTETHNRFVHLLVNILVKIAESDGRFTRAELQTMLNFFQYHLRYNQDQIYWVKGLIKEARQSKVTLEALMTEFRDGFVHEPRLILLELVYQLLATQHNLTDDSLRVAREMGAFFQISDYELRAIEAKYLYGERVEAGGQAEARHYAVLGLEPGTDFPAIKKAYRKLSMQYHPDKVSHLGSEFQRVAEEKMKEINGAYDYFQKNN